MDVVLNYLLFGVLFTLSILLYISMDEYVKYKQYPEIDWQELLICSLLLIFLWPVSLGVFIFCTLSNFLKIGEK